MNIFIRTDGNAAIGSGHVMRCLTLANFLRKDGAEIRFICRDYKDTLCNVIESAGFKIFKIRESGFLSNHFSAKNALKSSNRMDWEMDLEETASILLPWRGAVDLLIVDHYGLDRRWETPLRSYVKKIMVIDDLANRFHDCDLILDQNFFKNLSTRYDLWVPLHCRKLLGPKYALLRSEFLAAKTKMVERDGSVQKILVCFGGSDPTHETEKAIEAIKRLNRPELFIDVVIGRICPRREEIVKKCRSISNSSTHVDVGNMADLMLKADLAIGAGGTTNWERCILGLPSLIIVTAENQKEIVESLASAGIVWNLGWHAEIDAECLAGALNRALNNPQSLREMSRKGKEIMAETSFSWSHLLFDEGSGTEGKNALR